MRKPVNEQIDSELIDNQNALDSKYGEIISVVVENEDDIPFWKYVFNSFNIKTEISPNSRTLERGKKAVLKQAEHTGKYLLLCVDSDYDYIFNGSTTDSKTTLENPYIFQTYTYSIENYFCYSTALNQIMIEASLNDNEVFDYVAFFEAYSNLIYELFCYSIHYRTQYLIENEQFEVEMGALEKSLTVTEFKDWKSSNRPVEQFTIQDFLNTISLPQSLNIARDGDSILLEIEQKINAKLNQLSQLAEISDNDLEKIQSELTTLGINSAEAYLFVQGHFIEAFTLAILKHIYSHLKTQRFQVIREAAATKEEKTNKINSYKNHIDRFHLETALRTHKSYDSSIWFNKIKTDIENYNNTN
jgi:hypothetical protein